MADTQRVGLSQPPGRALRLGSGSTTDAPTRGLGAARCGGEPGEG
jgi:hypothetical protein